MWFECFGKGVWEAVEWWRVSRKCYFRIETKGTRTRGSDNTNITETRTRLTCPCFSWGTCTGHVSPCTRVIWNQTPKKKNRLQQGNEWDEDWMGAIFNIGFFYNICRYIRSLFMVCRRDIIKREKVFKNINLPVHTINKSRYIILH